MYLCEAYTVFKDMYEGDAEMCSFSSFCDLRLKNVLLKLLDSVDVEDRRRHGKIRSTMISDTGSYQGQIPLTEWSGERNSEQT